MSHTLYLTFGKKYKVVKAFIDFDGIIHSAGETWTFVRTDFLPYEDGLTLIVIPNNSSEEISYRLQWRVGQQAEIIDHFKEYVEEIK
ncbi:MAG: DUF3601 domain-containing protein [Saprospiraceae bacterium]